MDRSAQNSGTMPVRSGLGFDAERLEAWMRREVAGFTGPLAVEQFRGGQSNPTYRLATPGRAYVLRRKPPGKLLPGAHAVDREYRVLAALVKTPDWKKDLQDNFWDEGYEDAKATRKRLDDEYMEYKAILTDLGAAK